MTHNCKEACKEATHLEECVGWIKGTSLECRRWARIEWFTNLDVHRPQVDYLVQIKMSNARSDHWVWIIACGERHYQQSKHARRYKPYERQDLDTENLCDCRHSLTNTIFRHRLKSIYLFIYFMYKVRLRKHENQKHVALSNIEQNQTVSKKWEYMKNLCE